MASVSLSWTASTDPESGISRYEVERALASNGVFSIVGNPTSPAYVDTTVADSTTYLYRVWSVNGAGSRSTASSNTITVATGSVTPGGNPPGAPGIIAANDFGTAMIVTWNPPTTGNTPTQYLVEHNLGAGFVQYDTRPFGTNNSADQNPNLGPGLSTSYRLRATDGTDNGVYSAIVVGTFPPDTQDPDAPGNVVAAATGPNAAQVTWTDRGDDWGVLNFDVELGTGSPVVYGGNVIVNAPTTSHSRSGIAVGTHTFRVRARDESGNLSGWTVSNSFPVSDPSGGTTILMPAPNTAMPAEVAAKMAELVPEASTVMRNNGDLNHSNSEVIRSWIKYVSAPSGATLQFRRVGQTVVNTAGTGPGRYHVPQGCLFERSNINIDLNGCELFTGTADYAKDPAKTPKYDLTEENARNGLSSGQATFDNIDDDRFKWEPPSWHGNDYPWHDSDPGTPGYQRPAQIYRDHPNDWPQNRVVCKITSGSGNMHVFSSRPGARILGNGRMRKGGNPAYGSKYTEGDEGPSKAGSIVRVTGNPTTYRVPGGSRVNQDGVVFTNGSGDHTTAPPAASSLDLTNIDVSFHYGAPFSVGDGCRNVYVFGVTNPSMCTGLGGATADTTPAFVDAWDAINAGGEGYWIPGAAQPGLHHHGFQGVNISGNKQVGSGPTGVKYGPMDIFLGIKPNGTNAGFSIWQTARSNIDIEPETLISWAKRITIKNLYCGTHVNHFVANNGGGFTEDLLIENCTTTGSMTVQATGADIEVGGQPNRRLTVRGCRGLAEYTQIVINLEDMDTALIENNIQAISGVAGDGIFVGKRNSNIRAAHSSVAGGVAQLYPSTGFTNAENAQFT